MLFFTSWNIKTKIAVVLLFCILNFLHTLIVYQLGNSFQSSFYDSIISNSLLFLFCSASANIIFHYQPSAKTAWKLLLWCIILAVIIIVLQKITISKIIKLDSTFILNFDKTIPVRLVFAFLLIGITMLAVWIWKYALYQSENLSRNTKAELLEKEAELSKLTQQLQPHFLFNSLNSINSLISSKPEDARKMIQKLSDFFRGTLRKNENTFIKLEEEIKHINLYLDIEKTRFGHRLKTNFIINQKTENCIVPHLILQPLIENSIKYGLYETTNDVEIVLKTAFTNNMLIIEITNPIDIESTRNLNGSGFGLSSVSRRLFLLYSRMDLLITSINENIFSVQIKIPQQA